MDIHNVELVDAGGRPLYVVDANGKRVVPQGLPKTGQTTPYKDYDDGNYQKGLPLSGDRFTDIGDNTILDNVTGLQWINRPELIIPHGLNSNDVGVEKGDWVSGGPYAAGDIVTDPDYTAWICLIANTNTAADFATERAANPTYWQQSIWATSNGSGGVNPTTMVWCNDWGTPDALTACNGISAGGFSDWRLPNVKELMSIVDYGRVSPAIDPIFDNCQSYDYWSGTTYADDSG